MILWPFWHDLRWEGNKIMDDLAGGKNNNLKSIKSFVLFC